MWVELRGGDGDELRRRMAAERDAMAPNRYRAVLLAGAGGDQQAGGRGPGQAVR